MKSCLAISICLIALAPSGLWGQSALEDDRQMIEGLLDRQLFELAERYAAQRIVADSNSPAAQAEMAAELVRAYTLHALNAPSSERDRYWSSAAAVLPQFTKQFPDQPALVLVEVQDALTQLARVRLLRQEGEVLADSDKSQQAQYQALETLRRFEKLQEHVDDLLRQSHSSGKTAGLSSDQLLALSRRVTLNTIQALEEQGLAYPPDSLDRTNSMALAVQKVEPLTQLRPETGVLWPSLLLEIRALRWLGRLDQAEAKAARVMQLAPPPPVALAAKAEIVRTKLARGETNQALQLINQGRELEGQTSAELDFACFETYLALWKQAEEAKKPDEIQKWQNRSAAVVKELDQLYGPYWARRAEQQLTGNATSGGTQNVDLLRRTAEGYARKKQWDEALKTYDLGAKAAHESLDRSAEYELRLGAAAVAIQAGDLPAGVQRLRETALAFPAADDASLRHLTAAYYQSLIARKSNPPDLQPYIALLKENLQHWPEGEPGNQAAMWLGQIEFTRGKWREATEAYLEVPPTSRHFALAVDGVRQASLKWFQDAVNRDQLVQQDVQKVIDYFEQIVLRGQSANQEWTPTMRAAAETAAQLWLNYGRNGYDNARAILEVAQRSNPDASEGWHNRLESLQVIALAGLGKLNEAKARLQKAQDSSPFSLFEVLQALQQMAVSASPQVRGQIAELELTVIGMLRPNLAQLDEATRDVIATEEAEALANSGKLEAAIEAYQQIAQQKPTDADTQIGLARMLSRGTTQALQEKALTAWREVSRKSKSESPTWYEAKLEIARCHLKLGNPEEAKQIVRYLQTLYPDMGGPEMKSRFVQLMQQGSRP
ncbi:hypothetical protein C5Y97_18015 [Blastopirellula marina]|uniref:Tetratrico peptide repeat group 5 domain-containing protein n=2 Tax=Blastopirellula marina TaxID=124 RepID=A0A2S8FLG7_9BACT|nr:hypothetical protein C5Y98_18005 [Blastopirellula marina]PTL43196.1 hypothetical protein C5Y97_18015 [Blastopirellula marina]